VPRRITSPWSRAAQGARRRGGVDYQRAASWAPRPPSNPRQSSSPRPAPRPPRVRRAAPRGTTRREQTAPRGQAGTGHRGGHMMEAGGLLVGGTLVALEVGAPGGLADPPA